MRKAFAYLRVSGKSQVDGDGFPRQLLAIKGYADIHNLKIAQVFEEQGVSGTNELENRPALQDLLAALDKSIEVVIVEKLDRLARDLMISETIIADLRKRGLEVISVAEPDLCSSDPTRTLVRHMMGAIAQYEKTVLVNRMQAAKRRIRAKGERCEGVKPYGHTEREREYVDQMINLRERGHTLEAIAISLYNADIPTRSGKRWHAATVGKIINRHISQSLRDANLTTAEIISE